MKILIAHKYLFRGGGTTTYLLALKHALESQGHVVAPFTVGYAQALPSPYSRFYVSPPLGEAETHYADMRLTPWGVMKLLGRATYSLEARRKAGSLGDVVLPDVAYVHNIYNYMSPSILHAFKHRQIPIVMRIPDFNLVCPALVLMHEGQVCTECVDHGLLRAIPRRCVKGSFGATLARVVSMYIHRWIGVYEHVNLFITPSLFTRDLLVRAGMPSHKVVHLPSFAPPIPDREPSGDDGHHILYFGRVSREKGIDTLIDACGKIRPQIPTIIAGGGRDGELQRLNGRVKRVRLDNVEFVGHKQERDLYELLRRAAFVVVPSKWPDNCPMSVLESFAHGKPVIGARIGGIPEQIQNGAGMLFEPGHAEDLAAKMKLLLDNVSMRRKMGREALRRARTVYGIETHCERLLRLFAGVCTSAGVRNSP